MGERGGGKDMMDCTKGYGFCVLYSLVDSLLNPIG